jgi:hypothetical protein
MVAREMLLRRPLEMATRAALAVAMLVAAPPASCLAAADAARLIQRDGIVHFTNVPEGTGAATLVSPIGGPVRWRELRSLAFPRREV